MKRLVAFVAICLAASMPALGQKKHSWEVAEGKILPGTVIVVKARKNSGRCELRAMDDASLTCRKADGTTTLVYARADIRRIKIAQIMTSWGWQLGLWAPIGAVVGFFADPGEPGSWGYIGRGWDTLMGAAIFEVMLLAVDYFAGTVYKA